MLVLCQPDGIKRKPSEQVYTEKIFPKLSPAHTGVQMTACPVTENTSSGKQTHFLH